MLTLPSNMFSTVTLPATLWFFDREKQIDDFEKHKNKIEILFVDTRNVYHQIDRAHREFTAEQLQNLAAIQRLRKGDRKFFVELVHSHYTQAFEKLPVLHDTLKQAAEQLQTQLTAFTAWCKAQKPNKEQKEITDKEKFFEKLTALVVSDTKPILAQLQKAIAAFDAYSKKYSATEIEASNEQQHALLKQCETLLHDYLLLKKELEKNYREYEKLHNLADDHLKAKDDKAWKELNRPKEIRLLLDKLNEYSSAHKNNNYEEEEKSPVYFIKMAEWLQQRFPLAQYEDVTGLCKLVKIVDIEEQDYSLNPGRYVGVVIEEDGLTEEEFNEILINGNDLLSKLSSEALPLEKMITQNILLLTNE